MIRKETYEEALFETVRRGATEISPDVQRAFENAIAAETRPAAREGLARTYDSLLLSKKLRKPACPDTGWPVFYFRVGNEAEIEGGFMGIEEAMRSAVRRASAEGYIRKTMKHPLTGYDPGDNIGENIPYATWKFVPGNDLEMTYVAKGGGSECFGGTRHRVVAFADGVPGIEKCIIDWFTEATWYMDLQELGPFVVDIDTEGNNLYLEHEAEVDAKRKAAFEKLGIPEDYEYTKLY